MQDLVNENALVLFLRARFRSPLDKISTNLDGQSDRGTALRLSVTLDNKTAEDTPGKGEDVAGQRC